MRRWDDVPDEVLVVLVGRGEAGALRALADRYLDLMVEEATRIVGDSAAARDTAWGALEWLWEHRTDCEIRNVAPFLLRKTRTLALNETRRQARRAHRNALWLTAYRPSPPGPDVVLERAELRAALLAAVRCQPVRQRRLPVWRSTR